MAVLSDEQLEKLLVPRYVKQPDFQLAQKEAKVKQISLERWLLEKGLIQPDHLGWLIADVTGYPFIHLTPGVIGEIPQKVLYHLPELIARTQEAIVFEETEDSLKVATTNPENYEFLQHLQKITGKRVKFYYTTPLSVEIALRKYAGALHEKANILMEEIAQTPAMAEQNIVKFLDLLFEQAYSNLVSDVHIEPLADIAVVRFRIMGTLYNVFEYAKPLHERVVARIKILSRLRVDERTAPQDGSFIYRFKEETAKTSIDVRVSVIAVTEGEKIALRLLALLGRRFTLDALGLAEHDFKKMQVNIKKPWGMILAVGPTGCGKTTTMYSVVDILNVPEVNIMSIEDPVEYNIEGVHQIQVNPKKNVTFAAGLRSIVRQNPDIILVGEIRDKETVNIAIESAMTGHLVLSTLHANDAATTLVRLLNMGAESYLVASSINLVIAQRLVRILCSKCRKYYYLTPKEIELLEREQEFIEAIRKISGKKEISQIRFFQPGACRFCNHKGYTGRIGVFEVMEISQALQDLIMKRAPAGTIKMKAVEEGMTTMVYDAVAKALQGTTSWEEVRRAVK